MTATRTVTTSGTSTVLVTIRVKGGDKEYRGRTAAVAVDAKTLVKRTTAPAPATSCGSATRSPCTRAARPTGP